MERKHIADRNGPRVSNFLSYQIQQNLEGGFAEGGGISHGFGGVELCYVGSPKHVENPGIHRTINKKSTLYVASGTGGANQR